MRGLLKSARSVTMDHPRLFELRQRLEGKLAKRVLADLPSGDLGHVLLAPSTTGNIGDQAMIEAFLENVGGPVSVVTQDEVAVPPLELWVDRVRWFAVPGLTDGRAFRGREAWRVLRGLLAGARSFSVVGADVVDGAYSYRRSVQRVSLANYVATCGLPARILGFSWNHAPDPRALRALRSAGSAGVRLYARDPVSAARVRNRGIAGVHDAADLAFSANSRSELPPQAFVPGIGDDFAVVNVNGLPWQGGSEESKTSEYEEIVGSLLAAGLEVVILPHDSRVASSDVDAGRRLRERCESPSVHLIDRLLAPKEVRALAAAASIVVSGRMHLAILALWSGVPALTLSRQGKVEGLMQLFGAPELLLDYSPGFGREAASRSQRIIESLATWRERIATASDSVRELSRRNYEGIEA